MFQGSRNLSSGPQPLQPFESIQASVRPGTKQRLQAWALPDTWKRFYGYVPDHISRYQLTQNNTIELLSGTFRDKVTQQPIPAPHEHLLSVNEALRIRCTQLCQQVADEAKKLREENSRLQQQVITCSSRLLYVCCFPSINIGCNVPLQRTSTFTPQVLDLQVQVARGQEVRQVSND